MFVPRFALGTVALLALFTSVRGQWGPCNPFQMGDTSGVRVQLPTVEIPLGEDFDINIPTNACPSGTHVGTSIVGCDMYSSPTVKLDSLIHGTFHRNGNRYQTGEVRITVFCTPTARAQAEQAGAAAGNIQAQVAEARAWQ